ncbi:MAG: hypothetical protein IMZ61_10995 [Planctomycetes bacterium]|nr:hypothetical protein [Planctomycetota bacterium]
MRLLAARAVTPVTGQVIAVPLGVQVNQVPSLTSCTFTVPFEGMTVSTEKVTLETFVGFVDVSRT